MNKNSVTSCKVAAGNLARDVDLTTDELVALLDLTALLRRSPGGFADALKGRYISLLFEKPSLRTRLTFELAIKQLGGDGVLSVGPVGDREPLKDVARNLDRWTDAIVARVFAQTTIDDLAQWSKVPVINALSDLYHPCQALADVFTLREHFGETRGLRLAFVGDGNNVAHSLLLTATRLGIGVTVAAPEGYQPEAEIVSLASEFAVKSGAEVAVTADPRQAVRDADAVYTDVWASMGQEDQRAQRLKRFQPYQVNEDLFACAKRSAVFMHCLPAKRGEEVTDAVIESSQSVVFDQAENRLHTQKALLLMLLG